MNFLQILAQLNLENLDWGGKGFVYALQEAHLPGLIVSVILLILSIVSWSVMFAKFGMVSKASRQNYRFIKQFRGTKSAMELYERNFGVVGSPLFAVYRAGCREIAFHLLGSTEVDESTAARLRAAHCVTSDQMDAVETGMERAIGETTLHLENKMSFLATAVSGAPFLGLLGTVWGVMETFSGVAESGAAASIQSMAPGVSAALVTTVVALLVAIPAMFGYNYLINKIRTQIMEMNNFAAELATMFERQFVDYTPIIPMAGQQEIVTQQPTMAGQPAQTITTAVTVRPPMDEAFTRQVGEMEGPPINPIAQQAQQRRRKTL